jgi:hypothetical protein
VIFKNSAPRSNEMEVTNRLNLPTS